MRFLMIAADGWESLYLEGKFVDQGHEIEAGLLAAYLLSVENAEYREIFYDGPEDSEILAAYEGDPDYPDLFDNLPAELSTGEFNTLWYEADDHYTEPALRHIRNLGF